MQGVVMRRPRAKEEKERTKMRERHRRAITARILSGLRRHGNYNLRARADINEVISALAREAGWAVLPDGTTFPSRSASSSPQGPPATSSVAPAHIQPLRGVSPGGLRSAEFRPLKGVFTPTAASASASYDGRCRTSVMMGGHRERMVDSLPLAASCTDGVHGKQVYKLSHPFLLDLSHLIMPIHLYSIDFGVFVACNIQCHIGSRSAYSDGKMRYHST
uniref:Protein BZR1 homolog n=1 Tax=Elaeis guineensis var. tenera TaxID=51953 RepID=A0A6J0PCU7_ELAGV|nr:beta-amylase 7-like [Elaeis guineensis]